MKSGAGALKSSKKGSHILKNFLREPWKTDLIFSSLVTKATKASEEESDIVGGDVPNNAIIAFDCVDL